MLRLENNYNYPCQKGPILKWRRDSGRSIFEDSWITIIIDVRSEAVPVSINVPKDDSLNRNVTGCFWFGINFNIDHLNDLKSPRGVTLQRIIFFQVSM